MPLHDDAGGIDVGLDARLGTDLQLVHQQDLALERAVDSHVSFDQKTSSKIGIFTDRRVRVDLDLHQLSWDSI